MTNEVFVDTGGFYAMLDANDFWHVDAKQTVTLLRESGKHFVTTDYVLDETVTLFQARGIVHVATPWLEDLFQSGACEIVWMNAERFEQVRKFFAKHDDKQLFQLLCHAGAKHGASTCIRQAFSPSGF